MPRGSRRRPHRKPGRYPTPCFFFFQAEDGIRDLYVTGVQTCALPICDMFSLDRSSGASNWVSPVADGTHYQSVSTAAGVAWTVDGDSNLDGFEASSGLRSEERRVGKEWRGRGGRLRYEKEVDDRGGRR